METAEQARDAGIERVSENNPSWMDSALDAIRRLPLGRKMTGEQVRLAIVSAVGEPKHHNAWGAVIRTAVRRHILVPTGTHEKMQTVRSHARSTPVYFT